MSLLEDKIKSYVEAEIQNRAVIVPTLPKQAIDIMALEDEEALDTNVLIEALKQSPSISFSLFSLANLLTGSQLAKTYPLLIEQLGAEEAVTQAARMASQQMIQPVQSMIDKALRVATKTSHSTSVIAAQIARTQSQLSVETAQLAGLFHYIGAFTVIDYANDHEADIQDSITFETMIQALNTELSVQLLESASFDNEIVQAAKNYQEKNRGINTADYADIVQVAALLSQAPNDFDSLRQLESSKRLNMHIYSDEQWQVLVELGK